MKFEILQTGIRITFESGMLCAGCELYTTPNTEENLIFLFTLHHKDYYQIDPAFGVSEVDTIGGWDKDKLQCFTYIGHVYSRNFYACLH